MLTRAKKELKAARMRRAQEIVGDYFERYSEYHWGRRAVWSEEAEDFLNINYWPSTEKLEIEGELFTGLDPAEVLEHLTNLGVEKI